MTASLTQKRPNAFRTRVWLLSGFVTIRHGCFLNLDDKTLAPSWSIYKLNILRFCCCVRTDCNKITALPCSIPLYMSLTLVKYKTSFEDPNLCISAANGKHWQRLAETLVTAGSYLFSESFFFVYPFPSLTLVEGQMMWFWLKNILTKAFDQ